MRILIVCPCPLDRELGAAQIHLNLAGALADLGHAVRVWTPYPLPPGTHWAASVGAMREKLGSFLEGDGVFDIIDCPPVLIRRRFIRRGVTWVGRSVQPDLQYLWEELCGRAGRSPRALAKTAAVAAWSLGTSARIYRGWVASHVVMCLGAGEREWIGERFSWLRPKLRSYHGA